MRKISRFICGLAALLFCCAAQAADIKIEGTVITLSGDIVPGDANNLLEAIEEAERARVSNLTLSLNSNGGSFQEGLKMSKRLGKHTVRTVVKSGSVCRSACALVFLGGSQGVEAENEPDRMLEIGAQLGFHAPYLNKSTVTVEIGDLTQKLFEESKILNDHFNDIKIPVSIQKSLLTNDAQHSLYDATSMEAIELLRIRVPELDGEVVKVTRPMAIEGCINGFRYSQDEMPSKTSVADRKTFDLIGKKYKITMPEGKSGGFALIPAVRQKSGDVAVCRMAVDGVCQGFYDLDSIFKYSSEASQITELAGCQRENIATALVPPQTLLNDLKLALGKMQQDGEALLDAGTVIPSDAEDAPDLQAEKTVQPETDAVICNTREGMKFANVRQGPSGRDILVIALPNETPVKIVGEAANPLTNHIWKKIAFDGRTGFVDNELLSPICLVARAPAMPPPVIVAPPTSSRQALICNRKPGGDSANIRSSPNPLDSQILRKVFNNEVVNIIGEANNPNSGQLYFKVDVQGITGFVDNELVSTSCDTTRVIQGTAQVCNPKSRTTNMRSGPNPNNFGVVLELANNAEVTILDRTSNPVSGAPWLRVRAQGLEGFVDASSISTSCNITPTAFVTPPAGSRVICNNASNFTNMRLGPNKDMFDVVSQLRNGDDVRVLERTTNPVSQQPWLKIEARGTVGFVDADYVADGC